MTYYELWDTASANLLADFDTETEALDYVRNLVGTGDPAWRTDLSLCSRDADHQPQAIAQGVDLVHRATAVALMAKHEPSVSLSE